MTIVKLKNKNMLTAISETARRHTLGIAEPKATITKSFNEKTFYLNNKIRRIKKILNRLSAFHLVWTVVICMKEELDDEIKERDKFSGDLKKWSKKADEDFETYRKTIATCITENNIKNLQEDYEELDAKLREACNIEQKTTISFGRLLHAMEYLVSYGEVMKSYFIDDLGLDDYCRSLSGCINRLSNSAIKYLNEAEKAIPMKELPLDEAGFVKFMRSFLIKNY